MYTDPDFKTKSALNRAVKSGQKITIFQPGVGEHPKPTGTYTISGPHYPKPHTWYANVTLQDGYIVKIR